MAVGVDRPPSGADLREYGRVLWRRKWYVMLAVVVGIGAALGLSKVRHPQYKATASVLTQVPSQGPVDPTQIATEIGIMQSTTVQRLVDKTLPGASSSEIERGAIGCWLDR